MTRRATRIPLHLEVEYRTTGNFLVSYSTNLSKGGLFLQTEDLLPVGSNIKVRMRVPAVDDVLELEAVVAWTRPTPTPDGQPAGMGLEFSSLEGHYGDVIDRVVRGFRGIRILLLGEEGPARSQIARYLHSIVSCEVLELAAGGSIEAAIQQADLAVIDLDSSSTRGLAAVSAARSHGQAPVIALASGPEDRRDARKKGADELLAMPPLFADLQGAVIRALARPTRVK